MPMLFLPIGDWSVLRKSNLSQVQQNTALFVFKNVITLQIEYQYNTYSICRIFNIKGGRNGLAAIFLPRRKK